MAANPEVPTRAAAWPEQHFARTHATHAPMHARTLLLLLLLFLVAGGGLQRPEAFVSTGEFARHRGVCRGALLLMLAAVKLLLLLLLLWLLLRRRERRGHA